MKSKINKETAQETAVKSKKLSKEKKIATETVEVDPSAVSTTGAIPNISNKKFEKDDLLRFKLLEAKYQNAQMFVQLKSHEFEKAKAAWEAHGRELLAEIEKGQANFQALIKELSTLRAELEKKYSINMDKISYHESTGVIYEHQ